MQMLVMKYTNWLNIWQVQERFLLRLHQEELGKEGRHRHRGRRGLALPRVRTRPAQSAEGPILQHLPVLGAGARQGREEAGAAEHEEELQQRGRPGGRPIYGKKF